MTIDDDTAGLLVRLRIRETIDRYFQCCDAHDERGVVSCFAREGVFRFAAQPDVRIVGHAELEAAYKSFQRMGQSLHMASHVELAIDGETATGILRGMSVVSGKAREGDEVRVRGLLYKDRWIVEDGRWVIAERVHHALWQFAATQMDLSLPPSSD